MAHEDKKQEDKKPADLSLKGIDPTEKAIWGQMNVFIFTTGNGGKERLKKLFPFVAQECIQGTKSENKLETSYIEMPHTNFGEPEAEPMKDAAVLPPKVAGPEPVAVLIYVDEQGRLSFQFLSEYAYYSIVNYFHWGSRNNDILNTFRQEQKTYLSPPLVGKEGEKASSTKVSPYTLSDLLGSIASAWVKGWRSWGFFSKYQFKRWLDKPNRLPVPGFSPDEGATLMGPSEVWEPIKNVSEPNAISLDQKEVSHNAEVKKEDSSDSSDAKEEEVRDLQPENSQKDSPPPVENASPVVSTPNVNAQTDAPPNGSFSVVVKNAKKIWEHIYSGTASSEQAPPQQGASSDLSHVAPP